MGTCEQCGQNVKKLTRHALSRQEVCLRCIRESGYFVLEDRDVAEAEAGGERRASLRIPVTVALTFALNGQVDREALTHSAVTVDISATGLCLAWDACETCTGYKPGSVHPDCILRPYSTLIETPVPMDIELHLLEGHGVRLQAHAIHTAKEEALGLEYIGVRFAELDRETGRMLEQILVHAGTVSA